MDTIKTTSQRRQQASRRNGAQSKGPVTPEGKSRSSRNAVTHGVLATLLTFEPEEADLFNSIHAGYVARFEPRDQVEHDLVEEIVRAKWQMRQVWIYESATLGLQMSKDSLEVARDWKSLNEPDRCALAYAASVRDSNTLSNLQRYGRSLALQAERSMKVLLDLKNRRLPPEEEPVEATSGPLIPQERNEPSPISEHPANSGARAVTRAVYQYAISPAARRVPPASLNGYPSLEKAVAAGAGFSTCFAFGNA